MTTFVFKIIHYPLNRRFRIGGTSLSREEDYEDIGCASVASVLIQYTFTVLFVGFRFLINTKETRRGDGNGDRGYSPTDKFC